MFPFFHDPCFSKTTGGKIICFELCYLNFLGPSKRKQKVISVQSNRPRVPKLKITRKPVKPLDDFVAVLARLGKKGPPQSRPEYIFENDTMLEDEDFIHDDDDDGDETFKENQDIIEELEDDDAQFRKNTGFRSHPSYRSKASEMEVEDVIVIPNDKTHKESRKRKVKTLGRQESFKSSESSSSKLELQFLVFI